jgi:hypothetical protein
MNNQKELSLDILVRIPLALQGSLGIFQPKVLVLSPTSSRLLFRFFVAIYEVVGSGRGRFAWPSGDILSRMERTREQATVVDSLDSIKR